MSSVQGAGKPGVNIVPQNYQNFYNKVLAPKTGLGAQLSAVGQMVGPNIKAFTSGQRNLPAEVEQLQTQYANKLKNPVSRTITNLALSTSLRPWASTFQNVRDIPQWVPQDLNKIKSGGVNGLLGGADIVGKTMGIASGPFSVTPAGALYQTGVPMAAKGVQLAREGKPVNVAAMSQGPSENAFVSSALGLKNLKVKIKGQEVELPTNAVVDFVSMVLLSKLGSASSKAIDLNKMTKEYSKLTAAGDMEGAQNLLQNMVNKYPKDFGDLRTFEQGLQGLQPNQFRLMEKGIGLPQTTSTNITSAEELSAVTKNSLLNNPGSAKPGVIENYSNKEAITSLANNGKNLEGRIVVSVNDNGDLVLEDGRHLLEAYRQNGLGIPEGKLSFSTPEAEALYRQKMGLAQLSPEAQSFDEFLKSNKTYTYEDLQNMNQVASVKSQDPEFLKEFDKRFSKFYGSQQAARTTGAVETYKFKDISPEISKEVLFGMEDPNMKVSPKAEEFIKSLSTRYDELYNDAKTSGIDMNKVENYITHVWEQDPQTVINQYRIFKEKFGFGGTRTVPTYQEGIQMGLTPKYNGNPAGIIGEYVTKLEQAKENISMYKWLQDKEVIVPGSSLPDKTGFSPINAPGFPRSVYEIATKDGNGIKNISDWWAPDAVAQKINKFYAKPENDFWGKVLHATGSYSTGLQEVGLSGGIGPANFFTGGQTLKEVMAGRVKSPIAAFFRSWSKKASQEYFNANADTIVKMQQHDIPISTALNIEDILPKDLGSKTLGEKIGIVWNKLVNEATFKNFVPSLQVEFFKDTEAAALRGGSSAEEAANIAAQATKNFYGIVNGSDMALRSAWSKDLSRTIFLAPKYKESLINIWANSIKGLKNPFALENRANTKFLISAVASYFIYDKVNYALNGRHMNDNPTGTEDKILIPLRRLGINSDTVIGVPLLPSVGTIPRTLYKMGKDVAKLDLKQAGLESRNLLSFLVKPPLEIMANENYYGGEIYDPAASPQDRAKAIAKHLTAAWITVHPYINSVITRKPGEPLYQTVSKAMELPLRYYTEKSIASKFYYQEQNSTYTKLSKEEKAAFDAVPDADPSDPLASMFKYQVYLKYPAVFNAKKLTAIRTSQDNKQGVDPLYTAPVDVASKYILWKSLPPGSQDAKDLKKANPSVIALATARSDYYTANPIPPKPGAATYNAPQPSDYVQKQMDAKNWKDPQVRAYLDAYQAYQNEQRASMGLTPISSSGGSSYNPMKYFYPRVKKVTMKKNKTYAVKRIKLKKLAVRKLKSPKLAVTKIKKVKKIAVKTSAIKKIKLRA